VAQRNQAEVTRLLKRGLSHYGVGELDAAIASWQEALSLDPSNRAALDYLDAAREEAGYTQPRSKPRRPPAPVPIRRGQPAQSFRPADEEDTPRTLEGVLKEPSTPTESDTQIQEALRAYREGDLERSHELLETVARQEPDRIDVEGYLTMVRGKRAKAWVKAIGDQGRIPRLTVPTSRITGLQLRPDEGFLLSQVDGRTSIEQLLSLQTDRVRALEIMARFLRERIVE
jgi:tetratricopeptide (TPR) repeat protein